jgi:hypothetical protein
MPFLHGGRDMVIRTVMQQKPLKDRRLKDNRRTRKASMDKEPKLKRVATSSK